MFQKLLSVFLVLCIVNQAVSIDKADVSCTRLNPFSSVSFSSHHVEHIVDNASLSCDGEILLETLQPTEATNVLLIVIITSLIISTALSSAYDLRTTHLERLKRNQLWLSFSLPRNIRNLLSMDQSSTDTIHCLHGLRALSTFFIFFLHSHTFRTITPFRDEFVFQEWLKTDYASMVSGLNVWVDTFFVISAALTTRSMLKELDTGKFHIFKMFFQRYMRLTPSIAMVILLNFSLAHYFNDQQAPLGFLNYSVIPCQKWWWSTLLHLQVYTNPSQLCMHTTWYLSVEWQMTVIATLLIYAFWKAEKAALSLTKGLILASALYGFKIAYDYKFIAKDFDVTPNINGDFFQLIYYPTHIRGACYLIGVVLGHRLHIKTFVKMDQSEVIRMWTFSFFIIAGPFTIASSIYPIIKRIVFLNAICIVFSRILWGCVISWIIFACHHGQGGLINQILSSRYWMPIGKLGLSIYLMSPVLQYNLISSRAHPLNLEPTQMIFNALKDLLVSVCPSVCLYLLVEEPLSRVGKCLSKG